MRDATWEQGMRAGLGPGDDLRGDSGTRTGRGADERLETSVQ